MHYSLAIFTLAVLVEANPVALPQAVTAAIAPPEPAPPGCTPAYAGSFAIVAQNISATAGVAKRNEAAEPVCGQKATKVMAPVRQYIDGQIQGGMHTETITYQVPCPITQITDGQLQRPVATQVGDGQVQQPVATQVGDGQIQKPAATQIGDGQVQKPAASQVGDGQVQKPAASQVGDGQIQNPAASQVGDGQVQNPAATQIEDGQLQKSPSPATVPPITTPAAPSTPASVPLTSVGPPASPSPVISSTSTTTGDASASRPTLGSNGLESCAKEGALAITLEDGILKDQQGRTGYIAANYQFQFDGPPQAGAIITAGFSVCGNGSLALGGSNVFYQCLSGSFYNLYDRYWAAQCSPVTIDVINLKQC